MTIYEKITNVENAVIAAAINSATGSSHFDSCKLVIGMLEKMRLALTVEDAQKEYKNKKRKLLT